MALLEQRLEPVEVLARLTLRDLVRLGRRPGALGGL